MLAFVGIAVMVLGVALVLAGRFLAMRKPLLERWGGNVFVAGVVVWALHFAI